MTLFSACIASSASAATPALALWANRTAVDTDGDGVNDTGTFWDDNAPGVTNADQLDTDADHIGDAVDSTSSSIPYYGDGTLGLNGPITINAGGTVTFDYFLWTQPPSGPVDGDWGHIDLDFGGDGIYDATYFGPLTTSINTLSIPASFFTSSTWDLNTNGTYDLHALAYGPGRHSQYETYSGVIVVPEPTTVASLAAVGTLARRRRVR